MRNFIFRHLPAMALGLTSWVGMTRLDTFGQFCVTKQG